MKKQMEKRYREIGYNFEQKLTARSTADATGLWFAAAVLCAFLTAGVIVYRTGNPNMVTAANDVIPAAAHSGPLDPAPILPTR